MSLTPPASPRSQVPPPLERLQVRAEPRGEFPPRNLTPEIVGAAHNILFHVEPPVNDEPARY